MKFYYKIFLIAISLNAFSQTFTIKKNNKSFAIGLHTGYLYNSRVPAIALSPSLLFSVNKHQIQMGCDLYQKDTYLKVKHIIGLHASFNYFLRPETKMFNVFVNFNTQYVQYGEGGVGSVPYNYIRFENYETASYNMVRTKSFINTLGLGINQNLIKNLSVNFILGSGYNYYKSTDSPSLKYSGFKGISGFPADERTKFTAYIRLAIKYNLWKNYS